MRFSARWFGLLIACLAAVCVCRPAAADALNAPVRTALPAPGFSAAQPLAFVGAARGDATEHNAARRAVVDRVAVAPAAALFDPRSALVTDETPQTSSTTGGFASINAGVAPTNSLTVTKTGPAVVAVPLATIIVDTTEASTTITVDDASRLTVGQYIGIQYNSPPVYRVVSIEGNAVTLDQAVDVDSGWGVLGSIVYTITYRNDGVYTATNVLLTDTLPSDTDFFTATNGVLPYRDPEIGRDVVTWSLDELKAGDSGQVTLTLVTNDSFNRDPIVNHVELSSDQTPPVTAEFTTRPGLLHLSKVTTTPYVVQTSSGVTATYVLTVVAFSAGEEMIIPGNVIITDTLSPGFTYLGPYTYTYTGATRDTDFPEPEVGDPEPSFGAFELSSGDCCEGTQVGDPEPSFGAFESDFDTVRPTLVITFDVFISSTVRPGTYQNGFTVTSDKYAAAPFDPLMTTAEDVTVLAPELVMNKTVTPASVTAGERVTYTLAVQNQGNAAALGITITDTLPNGFAYVATTGFDQRSAVWTPIWDPVAGDIAPVWGVFDIDPQGALTITFQATATTVGGIYLNTVTAVPTNTTAVTATNLATVTVAAVADLGIVKTSAPKPFTAGQAITYTLVVTNAGPSTVATLLLTDNLPAGIVNPLYAWDSGAYSSTTHTWSNLDLATGGRITLTVTGAVIGTQSVDLTNTATVTPTDASDPNPDNNRATDLNLAEADLAVKYLSRRGHQDRVG